MNESQPTIPPKKVVRCRGCGAEIFFIKRSNGNLFPVNVVPTPGFIENSREDLEVINGLKPIYREVKVYISHFITCPNGEDFRKKRKKNAADSNNR